MFAGFAGFDPFCTNFRVRERDENSVIEKLLQNTPNPANPARS